MTHEDMVEMVVEGYRSEREELEPREAWTCICVALLATVVRCGHALDEATARASRALGEAAARLGLVIADDLWSSEVRA
jgi:hypothetical protein